MTKILKAGETFQPNADKIGVQITDDTPNCTVNYSIDGVSFTPHSTVLTEKNNVITSIPSGLYLQFTQDVIITV